MSDVRECIQGQIGWVDDPAGRSGNWQQTGLSEFDASSQAVEHRDDESV
jgi:hypothetical protein